MPDAAEQKAAAHAAVPEGNGVPVDSPGADLTGRTLGEFQILRKIGAGGMGQVYLARQLSLKRQVALKLLRKDLAGDPTAMKRFQAEAEAVATLNHPNIVQVYGAGESDGLRYMALEYVEGRNLRDHLARKGPPDLLITLSIMRQVATALQKAHEQGLVHRDIKPENILVTKRVEVKVTDFGLSRFFTGAEAVNLTQSGVTLGTPLYLSPEQAKGQAVDHRSDLYSFGVTCYHLLCGEPPFRGTTALEVALKHLTDQPRPLSELRPDLPTDLCAMVHKLMAKRAEDRYQSARDLLRDVAKVKDGMSLGAFANASGAVPLSLSSSQVAAVPSGGMHSLSRTGPPVSGLRWAMAAAAGLLAAALGVLTFLHLHPKPEPAAPAPPLTGLPDIRPAEKLATPRERELLATIRDRSTNADVWVSTAIELGLLYVREGRLDAAAARFESMEKELLGAPVATQSAHLTGRLGKAVVMAHRDNDPQYSRAAQASVKLFQEAIAGPFPNPFPKAKGDKFDAIRGFLVRHPDLAQAVADALNRNAINGVKLPNQLEQLRSPRSLSRKD
jgi:eukaryotic-like serine/threonine-protein kinase